MTAQVCTVHGGSALPCQICWWEAREAVPEPVKEVTAPAPGVLRISEPSREEVFIYRPEFPDRVRRLMHGSPYQVAVAYCEVAYPGMVITRSDCEVLGDAGLHMPRELARRGLDMVPDPSIDGVRVTRRDWGPWAVRPVRSHDSRGGTR